MHDFESQFSILSLVSTAIPGFTAAVYVEISVFPTFGFNVDTSCELQDLQFLPIGCATSLVSTLSCFNSIVNLLFCSREICLLSTYLSVTYGLSAISFNLLSPSMIFTSVLPFSLSYLSYSISLLTFMIASSGYYLRQLTGLISIRFEEGD